jgi:outer membrane protein assembly factor BamC
MFSVTRFFQVPSQSTLLRLSCLAIAASLAACSTIESYLLPDKVDYRTASRQTGGLEVPPDLTQLARDNRAQVQDGAISASAMQQASAPNAPKAAPDAAAVPAASATPVAISAVGDLRIERNGNARWLHSDLTPEQLWPQVRAFWLERGFALTREQADIGIMETDWVENRAKLKQDIIRSTIGKLFEGLYSTGERDSYRTRLERVTGGTEIYISQKGMKEVYADSEHTQTVWQPRPNEPELEAEYLSRLLLKLGGKTEQAATSSTAASGVASSATAASSALPSSALNNGGNARNRPLSEVPDSLEVNEGFERAWRRVGQSLDRHGFTIEDRDRTQGLFFLRYADPTQAGKEEPNFFVRLFTFSSEPAQTIHYRVSVKSSGEKTTVSVTDEKGKQQTSEVAKRILNLLMDDLR